MFPRNSYVVDNNIMAILHVIKRDINETAECVKAKSTVFLILNFLEKTLSVFERH